MDWEVYRGARPPLLLWIFDLPLPSHPLHCGQHGHVDDDGAATLHRRLGPEIRRSQRAASAEIVSNVDAPFEFEAGVDYVVREVAYASHDWNRVGAAFVVDERMVEFSPPIRIVRVQNVPLWNEFCSMLTGSKTCRTLWAPCYASTYSRVAQGGFNRSETLEFFANPATAMELCRPSPEGVLCLWYAHVAADAELNVVRCSQSAEAYASFCIFFSHEHFQQQGTDKGQQDSIPVLHPIPSSEAAFVWSSQRS